MVWVVGVGLITHGDFEDHVLWEAVACGGHSVLVLRRAGVGVNDEQKLLTRLRRAVHVQALFVLAWHLSPHVVNGSVGVRLIDHDEVDEANRLLD